MTIRQTVDLTPPGYWGQDRSRIRIVHNVLDQSDLAELFRYAKCNDEWSAVLSQYQWKDRVHRDFTETLAQQIADTLHRLVKRMVETEYGVALVSTGSQLNRWRVGDKQSPHADKQEVDGGPNCCPMYDLSSIFYLNDDYEGGELYFPNQDFEIKPIANTLVFFPGDVNYLHGVSEVKFGVRYTVSTFWTVVGIQ